MVFVKEEVVSFLEVGDFLLNGAFPFQVVAYPYLVVAFSCLVASFLVEVLLLAFLMVAFNLILEEEPLVLIPCQVLLHLYLDLLILMALIILME